MYMLFLNDLGCIWFSQKCKGNNREEKQKEIKRIEEIKTVKSDMLSLYHALKLFYLF